jgi:hypothetical protein
MNYTLDSVKHAKECLQELKKTTKIIETPIVTSLSDLENNVENIFFFGIVTNGSNNEKINFFLEDKKIITIAKNSQVIVLFSSIDIVKISGNVDEPEGQFRGFQIEVTY